MSHKPKKSVYGSFKLSEVITFIQQFYKSFIFINVSLQRKQFYKCFHKTTFRVDLLELHTDTHAQLHTNVLLHTHNSKFSSFPVIVIFRREHTCYAYVTSTISLRSHQKNRLL